MDEFDCAFCTTAGDEDTGGTATSGDMGAGILGASTDPTSGNSLGSANANLLDASVTSASAASENCNVPK